MNFQESWEFINKHDVNPVDVFIANEVMCYMCYRTYKEFEKHCKLVKEMWEKYEDLSIEEIVRQLTILFESGKRISRDSLRFALNMYR